MCNGGTPGLRRSPLCLSGVSPSRPQTRSNPAAPEVVLSNGATGASAPLLREVNSNPPPQKERRLPNNTAETARRPPHFTSPEGAPTSVDIAVEIADAKMRKAAKRRVLRGERAAESCRKGGLRAEVLAPRFSNIVGPFSCGDIALVSPARCLGGINYVEYAARVSRVKFDHRRATQKQRRQKFC